MVLAMTGPILFARQCMVSASRSGGGEQAGLACPYAPVKACPLTHMLMEVSSAYQGLAAWALCHHAAIRATVLPLETLGKDQDQDLANAMDANVVGGNGDPRPEAQGGEQVAAVHWIAMLVLEVSGADHVAVGDTHWSLLSGKSSGERDGRGRQAQAL